MTSRLAFTATIPMNRPSGLYRVLIVDQLSQLCALLKEKVCMIAFQTRPGSLNARFDAIRLKQGFEMPSKYRIVNCN